MAGRPPNGPLDNTSGSARDATRAAASKALLNQQLATQRKASKVK